MLCMYSVVSDNPFDQSPEPDLSPHSAASPHTLINQLFGRQHRCAAGSYNPRAPDKRRRPGSLPGSPTKSSSDNILCPVIEEMGGSGHSFGSACRSAMRTKRPDAPAANAAAAFFRSCGCFYAAVQPASWKRPFKATISMDFRPTFRRVMFELKHPGRSRCSEVI
jgi:hypothetical protein